MEKLTEKQKLMLETLKKYLAKYGYPPTVRELGKELDLSSPATTHFHLSKLESKGYIKKGKGKNRTIELLVPNEYLEDNDSVVDVALIGTITAGSPIEAIENPDEYFSVPVNLIPKRKEIFALNVKGTSMINKGIRDGDIVLIEKKKTANNGEIVAAMTGENEVTLKTFYKEQNHIRLQPENDTMAPIILDNVTILGKAVGLYRKI
jgi:repressor LexA